ncbi:hypothetical protein FRC07_003776 [Ceratobasidium sp. 392]|nr:hypothetical protein FRC07_003776 [Ceratobasidium sp. 392]
MNDALPKGNLDALLGGVPTVNTPYGAPNLATSDFELGDSMYPHRIIVAAGQECPTGLLPMGVGAVKMERSKDKDKSKTKKDKDNTDDPPKAKLAKPRRSEEDEYHLLIDAPLAPPTPLIQPSTASLRGPHTSGWSSVLEY